MTRMTTCSLCLVACLTVMGADRAMANSCSVVSNLTASQRPGTCLVDIHYDLADAEGDPGTISIQASDDGGATWNVPIVTVSGAVGPGVTPELGKLIVWDAGADIPGQAVTLTVRVNAADANCVPSGMAVIPAGEFLMGEALEDYRPDERPPRHVYVDAFYLGSREVTNEQYVEALNWARGQGLITYNGGIVYQAGSGMSYAYCSTIDDQTIPEDEPPAGPLGQYSRIAKEPGGAYVVTERPNHPVCVVSWYGAAAYANWRSVMQGRTPCYNLETWGCDFTVNGYRLPTEAEWEKAARGGLAGVRFPWSDSNEIQHARANYRSEPNSETRELYDTSPTHDYHPSFNDGTPPYTSPVGYFASNAYGLFDMAGNAREWCNDWYDETYYAGRPDHDSNPLGPLPPEDPINWPPPPDRTYRTARGGMWGNNAQGVRCANRYFHPPVLRYWGNGLRLAMGTSRAESAAFPVTAVPPIIFVSNCGDDANDGASWTTAKLTVEAGLNTALSGHEIWVAAGTYKPAGPNGNRGGTFQLKSGVALRGGFAGAEDPATFDLNTRDFTANPTILSGDLNGDDGPDFANNGENSYHVVTGSGAVAAVLDGFTVTAGNANASPYSGGGMYTVDASLTVANCTFTGNSARASSSTDACGGGMYNSGGALTLTDCTFSGNSASSTTSSRNSGCRSLGAGMYNLDGALTMTNCTFSENSACSYGPYSSSYPESLGGGMCSKGGSQTLTNCTFSGNLTNSFGQDHGSSGDSRGGGVYNEGGSQAITNCAFSANSTYVYNWYGDTVAYSFGGGMYNQGGTHRLTSCTFSGNSTRFDTDLHGSGYSGGGGLSNGSNAPTLINCTFTGNSASAPGHSFSLSVSGGGMYNSDGTPSLTNCTLSGNTAGNGGGIYSESSGTLTLTNCIVWGNGATYFGAEPQISGTATVTVTYSCVQGGWAGTGNISTDPILASVSGGNPRVRRGSPCIDAGDSTAPDLIGLTVDEDGKPRFVDVLESPDTGNGSAPIVDMGAYEHQAVAPAVLLVDDDAATGGDGQSWATAFKYLQDALAHAQTDHTVGEIWVAAGTYKPDQGLNETPGDYAATLQLISGVALRGGFAGTEDPDTLDLDTRDFPANTTILSGDLNGDDGPDFANNSENSTHVVTGSGVTTAVLDGFAVTAGRAYLSGGGMYAINGNLTLANCTFNGNLATGNGDYSEPARGGGMYSQGGIQKLLNCTFIANVVKTAGTNSSAHGGGMYNNGGTQELINCTFSGNSANSSTSYTPSQRYTTSSGGGMYSSGGAQTLTECIFDENSANCYNDGGEKCQNTSYGGGMYTEGGTSTLINCALSRNSTSSRDWGSNHSVGGGMSCSGTTTLVNCTFSGNAAIVRGSSSNGSWAHGGGLSGSGYLVTNCTFSGNSVSSTGSYSYAQGGGLSGGDLMLTNCIVWGNTALFPPQILVTYGTATVTYSCIQDGWEGTGNISADPLLRNVSNGDLRLQADSPCIDAGDNAAPDLTGIALDRAGRPRFIDAPWTPDTGSGTPPIVDMGAYEHQPISPADFDEDGDVDADDLEIFEACATGPAIPYNPAALPEPEPGCTLTPDGNGHIAADFDADDDVDQSDFGTFQRYYSPNTPPIGPGGAQ